MLTLTQNGIRGYLGELRKASLDELTKIATPTSALRHSLYGRNTVSKTGTVGVCDPTGVETFSISAYDAVFAIYNAANIHQHQEGLQWVGRCIKFAQDIVPWWIQKFGMPPGEDARYEPCHDRDLFYAEYLEALEDPEKAANNGDTDIRRHWGAYSMAVLSAKLLHLEMWTRQEAISFLWVIYADLVNSFTRVVKFKREYLRYGHSIAGMAGILEAAIALGDDNLKQAAYLWLITTTQWTYREEWATTNTGKDGAKLKLWTYGGYRYDDYLQTWTPAFPDGHFLYGGQAWYYGVCTRALARAWGSFAIAGDLVNSDWCLSRFFSQTDWMNPAQRSNLPTAPINPEDPTAGHFHNAIALGGTRPNAKHPPYVCQEDYQDGLVLDVNDFENLKENDPFIRPCGVEFHEGDENPYWSTTYKDPGGTTHQRGHGNAGRQPPGLPGHDTINPSALPGCITLRGVGLGDNNTRRYGEIHAALAAAFCNTSDLERSLKNAIRPDQGLHTSLNRVGGFSRAYCWTWMAMDEACLALNC